VKTGSFVVCDNTRSAPGEGDPVVEGTNQGRKVVRHARRAFWRSRSYREEGSDLMPLRLKCRRRPGSIVGRGDRLTEPS